MVLSLAIAVTFLVLKNYGMAAGFFVASIAFFIVFRQNFNRSKKFVNGKNLLMLKPAVLKKENAQIKNHLRNNLTFNHYRLEDGFYVNRKNKNYDVYFSTYTRDNLQEKLDTICTRFEKDADHLQNIVKSAGFMSAPVDIADVSYRMVTGARHYEKEELFSRQRRKYFIFVGIDNDNPPPKPTFTFWVFPYNAPQSIDLLSFVDISRKLTVARLDTMPFNRNPELCQEIRKIFKGIIDFDAEVSIERIKEQMKHD